MNDDNADNNSIQSVASNNTISNLVNTINRIESINDNLTAVGVMTINNNTPNVTTGQFLSNNTKSSEFVHNCIKHGIPNSIKILVCTAVFQKISFIKQFDDIPMENIRLFLNISKLIMINGIEGQEHLVQILRTLWKYLPLNDNGWLPIPHTINMFQTHILNPTNKYSLVNLLPTPHQGNDSLQNHAFCSIKETLSYMVFFGQDKGKNNVKYIHQKLVQSKIVVKFLDDIKQLLQPHTISVLCMFFFG